MSVASVTLSHPSLGNRKIIIVRLGEDCWQVAACNYPNGRQTDGLEELCSSNLTLSTFRSEAPPVLVSKE